MFENRRLPFEQFQRFPALHTGDVKLLDRDRPPGRQLNRLVGRSHTALPQHMLDLILPSNFFAYLHILTHLT